SVPAPSTHTTPATLPLLSPPSPQAPLLAARIQPPPPRWAALAARSICGARQHYPACPLPRPPSSTHRAPAAPTTTKIGQSTSSLPPSTPVHAAASPPRFALCISPKLFSRPPAPDRASSSNLFPHAPDAAQSGRGRKASTRDPDSSHPAAD